MAFAFISYSRKDHLVAEKLGKELGKENVFLDKWNLETGDLLPKELARNISESKWFILIASNSSMQTNWVRFELNIAIIKSIEDQNYKILVMKIDNCNLHDELKPFLRVESTDTDEAIQKIKNEIKREIESGLSTAKEENSFFINRYSEMGAIEDLKNEGTKIIFLWGLYGIGKSTLLKEVSRKIFQNTYVKFHFSSSFDLLKFSLEAASKSRNALPSPTSTKEEQIEITIRSLLDIDKNDQIIFFKDLEKVLDEEGNLPIYLENIFAQLSKKINKPIFISSTRYPKLTSNLINTSQIIKIDRLQDKHAVFCLKKWLDITIPDNQIPEKDIKKIAPRLFGYPLVIRLASSLIAKFSIDYLQQDLSHFEKLRKDIAIHLIGENRSHLTDLEVNALDILALSEDGFSLSELAEGLKKDPNEIRKIISKLFSNLLVQAEDARIQLHPLLKEYFLTNIQSKSNWMSICLELGKNAKSKIPTVPIGSEEYVRLISQAYRFFVLANEIEKARELKYYFDGSLKEAALNYFRTMQTKTSMKFIDLYLQMNPDDNLMTWYKIRCLTRMKNYEPAEELLTKLESKNYSPYKIHHARGLLYRNQKELTLAKLEFEKGLEFRKDYLPLIRDLGEVYFRLGDIKRSAAILQRGYEISPRDEYIITIYLDVLEAQGKISKAISIVGSLISTYPEKAIFYHKASILQSKLNNFPEAYKYAKEAVRLDPTLIEAKLRLASLEIHNDNIPEASQILDSMPSELPNNSEKIKDTILAEIELKKSNFAQAKDLIKKHRDFKKDSYCVDVYARAELQEALYHLANQDEKSANLCLCNGKNVLEEAVRNDPENIVLQNTLAKFNDIEGLN